MSPNQAIFEKIQEIISQRLIQKNSVIDLNFQINKNFFDELDIAEMILDLEEKFDIELPNDLIDQNFTVQELIALISKKNP